MANDQQQTNEPNVERLKRIKARQERMASFVPPGRGPVRVEPATADVRKFMRHPNGVRFPESGSVEWPLDRFTRRRIADGSVKVSEAPQNPQPVHGRRHAPPSAE